MTQDSYLGEQGVPPSLDRYLYGYSNPTVYVDHYGYDAVTTRKKPIEYRGRIYEGEERVYWVVQSSPNDMFPDFDKRWHDIGRPGKNENGKPVVYLTEEFGGDTVSYERLQYLATRFWDRESCLGINADGKAIQNISRLSYNSQRGVVKNFINHYARKINEPRIEAAYQESIAEQLDPIRQINKDFIAVKSGTRRIDEVAGDYAFDAVLAYLGTKAGSQLLKKLSPPVIRYLEKKFGKKAIQAAEEGVEELVEKGIDSSKITKKPYSNPNSRPPYAKGQVEKVWENAQDIDGKVYDPNTGEELFWDKSKPRRGQWDMGHLPESKYSELHKKYREGEIDFDTFINEVRNVDNYRPESPAANQGHKYE